MMMQQKYIQQQHNLINIFVIKMMSKSKIAKLKQSTQQYQAQQHPNMLINQDKLDAKDDLGQKVIEEEGVDESKNV